MVRSIRIVLLASLCVSLGGCFYWQAIGGQLELLRKRTPIEKLLSDPRSRPEAQDLAFGRNRDSPVRERRAAACRTTTATRATSISAARMSFGTSSRRKSSPSSRSGGASRSPGASRTEAFSSARPRRNSLRGSRVEGLDIYSGGATAYSTLGYFDDPVLSTMIGGGEQYIASLLFHELAHQKLYVKDDSEFSEAFATAVEEHGTERWLSTHDSAEALDLYRRRLRRRADFADLVLAQQARLRSIFASAEPQDSKRAAKARAFDSMRADYAALKVRWGGSADYDAWFSQPLNNATLAAVATYRRWVPALRSRIAAVGLEAFYAEMSELAELPPGERTARLQAVARRGVSRAERSGASGLAVPRSSLAPSRSARLRASTAAVTRRAAGCRRRRSRRRAT